MLRKIQVPEILMNYTLSVYADFHQGDALIFVEVNVCFALSKASVTVNGVQRLHMLSSKSFNIIY
jgi:hypothetical protein